MSFLTGPSLLLGPAAPSRLAERRGRPWAGGKPRTRDLSVTTAAGYPARRRLVTWDREMRTGTSARARHRRPCARWL